MKSKVAVNNKNLGICLFVLIATTMSMLSGMINHSIFVIIGLVFIALFLYAGFKYRIDIKDLFLWILFFMPFLYSMKGLYYFSDIIFYIVAVLFLLCCSRTIDAYESSMSLVFGLGAINALLVIGQKILPDLYVSIFRIIYNSSSLNYILRILKAGYLNGLNWNLQETNGIIIFGLAALIYTAHKRKKSVTVFWTVIMVISLVLSGKRSMPVIALATFLIVKFISEKNRSFGIRVIKYTAVAVILGVGAYLLIMYGPEWQTLLRLRETITDFFEGVDVTSGRNSLFASAWEMFRESPVLGKGWKYFLQTTTTYVSDGYYHQNYVNNCYLQALTETGIVGFLLFYTPIIVTYVRALKKLILAGKDRVRFSYSNKMCLQFAVYIQTFFLLYNFIEIPFYDMMFFYFLIYAFAISNCKSKDIAH